jgi:phenylpyruvate tautomerase PptA (4-oxalocrotonate tautomerase family)
MLISYATWQIRSMKKVIRMPTYFCSSPSGRLTTEQKRKIAGEITRIHSEVTGAPSFFAQVIFHEVNPGGWFIGGLPLTHEHIFVYGHPSRTCGRRQDSHDKADGRSCCASSSGW